MDGLREINSTIQEQISNLTENVSGNLKLCLTRLQNWLENGNWNSENDLLEKYKFIATSALSLCNEARDTSNNSLHLYDVIFCLITCLPNVKTLQSESENLEKSTITLAAVMEIYCNMDWLKIKLKIALKYARLLLLNQNYSRTVTCLKFAEKIGRIIFRNLSAQAASNKFSLACSSTRVETHQDLITCYLYQTETSAACADYESAKTTFQSAKCMLTDFVNVKDYMTALCFNIGIDLFQLQRYEESVFWITQSLEAGSSSIYSNKAGTMILLAEAYLLWDGKLHFHDALNALQLADNENVNWECNFLKLRAHIVGNVSLDDIQCAVHHCCQTAELSQEKGLQIIEILLKSGHKNLAVTTMSSLETILISAKKADKIFEQHLKLLIEENLLSEAEEVVKNYVLCYSGTNVSEKILANVENQASLLKDSKIFVKAMVWFDLCIQIATKCDPSHMDDLRLVRFYHQKCSCLLELGWYNETYETLMLAEKCAPHHVLNDYFRLKLCIIQQDDKGLLIVQSICTKLKTSDGSDDIAKVIMLCAEFGLKQSKFQVTIHLLEDFIGKEVDASARVTAMRYLLKLKIRMQFDFTSQGGQEWLLAFSNKVCQALECVTDAWGVNQAKWFLKMLWNLAHLNKENPLIIQRLLCACNKILKTYDNGDATTFLQRITCLISSVAAGLQVMHLILSHDENATIREILENIEELKILCNEQNNQLCTNELVDAFKSTRRFLLICEFEAKARIHAHDLENIFEAAFSLPDMDAKTFEHLAAIAHSNGQHCYSLTVRSIKAAISKHMELVPPNYEKVGRLYHSLLCAVLTKMEKNRSYENDFGKFLVEIHDLVKSTGNYQFPQSELLWFITKAWNVSIKIRLQYGHNSEAMHWAQLALGLTNHLVSLRNTYQNQMNVIYYQMLRELPVNGEGTENLICNLQQNEMFQ